ncbi:hypothetical protein J6590_107689, partial [Homalodisca vitripennis]
LSVSVVYREVTGDNCNDRNNDFHTTQPSDKSDLQMKRVHRHCKLKLYSVIRACALMALVVGLSCQSSPVISVSIDQL